MKTTPHFVVCTKHSTSSFVSNSQTSKFFEDNLLKEGEQYTVFYKNTESLSKRYNEMLDKTDTGTLVFVHDDVIIPHHYDTITRELENAHKRFDIVGLAGATKLSMSYPTLWHLMAQARSGSVGHSIDGMFQVTNFGPSPANCIVVDGLFMSVNVEAVKRKKVRFDERFTFHHYDLDFCLQAHFNHLRIGTWPIWVTHMSPGLRSLDDPTWQASNKIFSTKHSIDQ